MEGDAGLGVELVAAEAVDQVGRAVPHAVGREAWKGKQASEKFENLGQIIHAC